MSSLGAFIITFDRPAVLAETLRCLLGQSLPPARVLVLDNGSNPATGEAVAALADPRVEYDSMGGNSGPAGAAARGVEQLAREGFDWIYWGDDDDPPRTTDTLERLVRLGAGHERVGAVGAVGTRWDWDHGRVVRLPDAALHGAVEVDTIAGSSQLVISAAAAREVGLPNAELFFGFEEPEYCLRLRQAGYRHLVEGELMLEYRRQAGRLNLPSRRALRPRRSRSEIWRQYYSTRNYIHLMRKTFERPDLARRELMRAAARIATSWGHGPGYGAAFTRLQARGVLDGYLSRLGCTVLPVRKDANR